MDDLKLADLRREYARHTLDEGEVHPDPLQQFGAWFADAERAGLLEPNAMTLATSDPTGRPSARIVLLKEVTARGFVFYTDYRSRKGTELERNPQAALVFLWKELERQVRVTGSVARVTREESAAYFSSRPLGSRLGAWASEQSAVIPGREWLTTALARATAQHPTDDVALPPHWGGYRVAPDEVEFWQGRPDRLHDRVRYRHEDGRWVVERLSP